MKILLALALTASLTTGYNWTATRTNNANTVSGYTRVASPYEAGGYWTARAQLTDVGNDWHEAEDCHASLTAVRSDGKTLAYLTWDTWPRGSNNYQHTVSRTIAVNSGTRTVQIRASVWATLHYAADESHFAPVTNACALIVQAWRS